MAWSAGDAIVGRLRRPATWAALALAVFSLVTVQFIYADVHTDSGLGELALCWGYVACGVAAGAAWEASDVAPVLRRRRIRGLLARVWPFCLLPVLLFTLLVIGVAVSRGTATPAPSTASFLLVALLHGVAWTVLGAAVGSWLPTLIAVPVAALLAFLLIAIPPGVSTGPWRHMFGAIHPHGGAGEILRVEVVLASAAGLFAVVLFGAALLATRWRAWGSAVALALAAGLVFAAGWRQAPEDDPFQVRSRPAAELRCAGGICSWPETPSEQVRITREAMSRFRDSAPPEWVPEPMPPVLARDWNSPEEALSAWYLELLTGDPGVVGDEACRAAIRSLAGGTIGPRPVPGHRLTVDEVARMVDSALAAAGRRPCAQR